MVFWTAIVISETTLILIVKAVIANYLAFMKLLSNICQILHKYYHYSEFDASIISTTCCEYSVKMCGCQRDQASVGD